MQQNQSSVFIFNRHPTPIGKSNDYLQELPVANMKVVSAVLNGRPRSCAEVYHQGFQKNGIFSIWPQFNSSARLQLYAYCDMVTDGGGWTVVQRRGDFGGEHENFTRLWADYKRGFGHVSREFWLGLDPIYALTHQEDVELRIEIETWRGVKRFANYYEFQIADESDFYRLTVGNFTGDVEDCFSSYHNGVLFSTIDSNNAGHKSRECARHQGEGGGWWYDNCYMVKLNSIFYPQGDVDRGQGVQWRCWSGYWYSLKHVEMKVRPLCFPEKCNKN
uniref:Fibrinogen C-terminal domain-containing protein n=1 Tax=Strigamia maritima TaxID=126957 RepID=T1JHV0_STRMM